ncbi:MAG TPA: hypothetical protein VNU19_17305, partial [Candidatus Acidoferrum sp.]|nr:hypothetical protein [Candidatus Acidoferrum sp.]
GTTQLLRREPEDLMQAAATQQLTKHAQARVPRYFALDGTGHATREEQASMIRRYIIWRNNHAYDERLRRIATRANIS